MLKSSVLYADEAQMKGLVPDKVPTTNHETRFMNRDPGKGLGVVGRGEIVCERFVNKFCKKISDKNSYTPRLTREERVSQGSWTVIRGL